MNKKNAHLFLPLVQALADGKTLQLKKSYNNEWWEDFGDDDPVSFCGDPSCYRIKPGPRMFERYLNKETGTMITVNHYKANNYDERYFDDFERITVQEVLE